MNSPTTRDSARRSVPLMHAAVLVALGGLAFSACSGADSTTEQSVVTAPPIPSTTTTTLPPVTAPPTTVALTTTTAPATTTTEAPTTTTLPPGAALVMRPDGLGTAFFGADPEGVVAYVTSILGPPTSDSDWVNAFDSPYGVCPGSQVRGVTWFDLVLLFSDATDLSTSTQHFFHYQFGGNGTESQPQGLATESGLSLGATVPKLRELYPDVQVFDDELFGPTFAVSANGLTGSLTSSADDGLVTLISAGQGCGE